MKPILFILLLGFLISCNNASESTPNDLDQTRNRDTNNINRDTLVKRPDSTSINH